MINIGSKAPEFTLLNSEGVKTSLSDFLGKIVVLYFYPKDNTPGCTTQLCDFRDSFDRLTSKGMVVLGVSADSVESHAKFKAKHGSPIILLSDPDKVVIKLYDSWKEKSIYGKSFLGIQRSTVLIDKKGVIFHHFPKVSAKGHVEQILKVLEESESSK